MFVHNLEQFFIDNVLNFEVGSEKLSWLKVSTWLSTRALVFIGSLSTSRLAPSLNAKDVTPQLPAISVFRFSSDSKGKLVNPLKPVMSRYSSFSANARPSILASDVFSVLVLPITSFLS